MYHRYAKEWQEQQRHIITSKINNTVILPQDIIFASFDYGENIICAHKKHPHNGTLKKLSLLAIHEVSNVTGNVVKRNVCCISNEPSHAWYSAVPAYKKYLQLRKSDYRNRGIALKTVVLWSDRGPSDFWTGPFIVYAIDISVENNVNLNVNTSATSHGKYTHDQIVSTVKKKATYGFKEGLITITSGCSVAGQACNWLRSVFGVSQSGSVQRQFIEIPAADIRVANSPVSRLLSKDKKGIKSYHCLFADIAGNVKFRSYSCYCQSCLSSGFCACSKNAYCGDWVDCDMKEHLNYDSIERKTNSRRRRRFSCDTNHNNRY